MFRILNEKKECELAVMQAIESICEDICGTTNENENKVRAETILLLVRALD